MSKHVEQWSEDETRENHLSLFARGVRSATYTHGEYAAEKLARIGAYLGALRVELFSVDSHRQVELEGWWTVHGQDQLRTLLYPAGIRTNWFPWSIGDLAPAEFVFVRNAATLPAFPSATTCLGDFGIASAVHVPVIYGARASAGLCAYWGEPIDEWTSEQQWKVLEWTREAYEGPHF